LEGTGRSNFKMDGTAIEGYKIGKNVLNLLFCNKSIKQLTKSADKVKQN